MAIAISLLSRHDHDGTGTALERQNCGACVLNGYGDKKLMLEGLPCQPNYSGWARVYVQAGKTIPEKYREAFILELTSENARYREALLQDIKSNGVALL